MGFRFRKSKNFGPFRVTASKSGIGFSAGVKGFRATKKAGGGYRATASIPGTGISYVKDFGSKKSKKAASSGEPSAEQPKSKGVEAVLCLFLGFTGAHRFYTRRYGTAVLYLLTLGCLGVGWLGDILRLLIGLFDRSGRLNAQPWKALIYGVCAVLLLVVLGNAPGQADVPPSGTTPPGTSLPYSVTDPATATEPPAADPPATKPPVTDPPATRPPVTDPPATKPPVTDPPATKPPVTAPPATKPADDIPQIYAWDGTVSRNEVVTLTVKGKPDTRYTIKVYYSSGASKADGLEDHVSDGSGLVSWTWKIGGKTNPGEYHIEITGGDKTIIIPFTVVE